MRTAGVILLSGSLLPLPRGFRNLAGGSLHFHRECISLVVGPGIGHGFRVHTRFVGFVEGCLSGVGCVRIRAPMLGAVINNTTTHPFIARRGALGVPVCVHVTARLPLGHLVINNVSEICRVNHVFEGRNVSPGRGPRFAAIRLCRTCTSFRSVVSVTRNVVSKTTGRVRNACRIR